MRYANLGLHQIERAPDLALLLAAEAYDLAPTEEARNALLSTLDHQSRLLTWIKDPGSDISAVAYHPVGTLLATGLNDGRILFWDGVSHQQVGTLPDKHTDGISCLAFSPEGHQLASGSYDGSVILWDVNSRCDQRTFGGSRKLWVESVAFSRSGGMLAIAAGGVTVKALDGRAVDRPIFHTSGASVMDLVFTPDEESLLIASTANLMRGSLASMADEIEVLPFAPDGCVSLALSPDGFLLAVGLPDAMVALWDITTGIPMGRPLTAEQGPIDSMVSTADGKQLVTGPDMIYWTIDPSDWAAIARKVANCGLADNERLRYLDEGRSTEMMTVGLWIPFSSHLYIYPLLIVGEIILKSSIC